MLCPSLRQIAAHHIMSNLGKIEARFGEAPASVRTLAQNLKEEADSYLVLTERREQFISIEGNGTYNVDIWGLGIDYNRASIGLATGAYLTIRRQCGNEGKIGEVLQCPMCNKPATQIHFLNECPINEVIRRNLLQNVDNGLYIEALAHRDFDRVFASSRSLKVLALNPATDVALFDDRYSLPLQRLAQLVCHSAERFVSQTLNLFEDNPAVKHKRAEKHLHTSATSAISLDAFQGKHDSEKKN
jgi:phage terminase small subunit